MNKTSNAEVRQAVQWRNLPQLARPLARYRLTLREGETYTLSSSTREVRILSGAACILDDEREVILIYGEQRGIAVERGDR